MENEGKGVIIHLLPIKRLLYNTYNASCQNCYLKITFLMLCL